jgi:hypothetical protein
MNITLGNSVRLPLRSHPEFNPARPLQVSKTVPINLAVPPKPSPTEPAGLPPAGSPQRKSDTQLFLQRVFGLNVQLSPPTPSALAD